MRNIQTNGKAASQVKDRRTLMFLLGATEAEIRRCLKERKMQLVRLGAKADNIPTKVEKCAEFIGRLPNPAMETIRTWFAGNVEFDRVGDAAHACEQLSIDPDGASRSVEEQRLLWRSVLAGYVKPGIEVGVELFLTEVPRLPKKTLRVKLDTPQAKISEDDAAAVLSIVEGSVPSEVPTAALPALVAGVIAALRDDSARLVAIRQYFENEGTDAGRTLVATLDTLRGNPKLQGGSPAASSPRACIGLSDIALEDTGSLTVLGAVTNRLSTGQFFIRVGGIVQGDDLVALSPDESKRVIPETGDATAFPDTIPDYHAAQDSLAVWRVEYQGSEHRVRYVIKSFISHVHDVFDVPHPSSDPDGVRYWLKEVYKHSSTVFPVFRLADGLIVRFPNHATDPRLADFEAPLHAYRSHPVVLWKSRQIVITPFSHPDFRYDCAPVGKLVKRLIKSHADLVDMPTITNRQLNELVDWTVREGSDRLLMQSVERVRNQLGQALSAKEQVDEVMIDLLGLPSVRQAIEVETKRLAEEGNQELSRSRAQLAHLEHEKKRCQAEIDELRARAKKESTTLSREIRRAFEKATQEGMATLANVALFKGVLGMGAIDDAALQGAPPDCGATPAEVSGCAVAPGDAFERRGREIATIKQLDGQIQVLNFSRGVSPTLAKAAVSAVASNGVVALTGRKRDEISLSLVSMLAGGIDCKVSVTADMFGPADLLNAAAVVGNTGQQRAMPLGDFLELQQSTNRPTVVRLQGFNRAPPESILPELMDLSAPEACNSSLGWTDRKGIPRLLQKTSPIILVLDFASGRSVFPCTAALAWEIPIVDSDLPYPDSGEPNAGGPVPEAHVSAAFLRSLAGELLPPAHFAIGRLPKPAQRGAMRMASICESIGVGALSARALSIAAFARGRVDLQSYVELLTMALDGLSPTELESTMLQPNDPLPAQHLFDIGNEQAK